MSSPHVREYHGSSEVGVKHQPKTFCRAQLNLDSMMVLAQSVEPGTLGLRGD
jgi:hypothetical protein